MITLKRIHILIVILLAFVVINSASVSAITGSIGNARMILYPEISGGKTATIEKTILVKNVNDVSINIKLETDENSTKFIKIIDKEFSLNPGEEKRADFKVEVNKEGRYEGKINVFFTPSEGKDPGVVLSSTVIVIAGGGGSQADAAENTGANNETDSITKKAVDSNGNKTITPILLIMSFSSIILIVVLIFLSKSLKKPAVSIRENKKEKIKKINEKGERK